MCWFSPNASPWAPVSCQRRACVVRQIIPSNSALCSPAPLIQMILPLLLLLASLLQQYGSEAETSHLSKFNLPGVKEQNGEFSLQPSPKDVYHAEFSCCGKLNENSAPKYWLRNASCWLNNAVNDFEKVPLYSKGGSLNSLKSQVPEIKRHHSCSSSGSRWYILLSDTLNQFCHQPYQDCTASVTWIK